jgi:hypothetical protein
MSAVRKFATVLVGLGLMASSFVAGAITLSIPDQYYLGEFRPGQPASDADEAQSINLLNDLAAGQGDTACGGRTCNRAVSTLAGPFSNAVYAGRFQGNNANLGALSYQYVLAKYGNVASRVWYSPTGFTGTVTVPGDYPGNGGGLSHISWFSQVTTTTTSSSGGNVPEPGTMGLLGLGLLGLGFLRRAKRAA